MRAIGHCIQYSYEYQRQLSVFIAAINPTTIIILLVPILDSQLHHWIESSVQFDLTIFIFKYYTIELLLAMYCMKYQFTNTETT